MQSMRYVNLLLKTVNKVLNGRPTFELPLLLTTSKI